MLNRIASLEPSVTATLTALGEQHRLVSVTRYCNRLVDVGDLPQLETTWSVKADQIVRLEPQLVVAGTPYSPGKVDELLREGLNVLCLYPRSLDEAYAHIVWLGRLCDVADRAERLVTDMRRNLSALAQAATNKPRQRVYVEAWPDPLISAPSWVAEIVGILGGDVVPHSPGRQINSEEVIKADPQLIILSWAGITSIDPGKVFTRPGWEVISAVRRKRVVEVNEILVNAPGPNLVDGARQIWDALYPEEPFRDQA